MRRVRALCIRYAAAALLSLAALPARGGEAPDAGAPDAAPASEVFRQTSSAALRDLFVPRKSGTITVRAYVDLGLRLRAGQITIERARPGRHAAPVAQPIFRGRWLARVVPRALLHARPTADALAALDATAPAAVPFDFPLLAEADSGEEQRMDAFIRDPSRVRADATVRVPAPDGAGDLRDLVAVVADTRTGRVVTRPLPIPPPR